MKLQATFFKMLRARSIHITFKFLISLRFRISLPTCLTLFNYFTALTPRHPHKIPDSVVVHLSVERRA